MKTSRSVFEPELGPLFTDFADAGMCGALARLRARLAERVPALELPEWLWSLDYEFAVTECARCRCAVQQLLEAFQSARRTLSGEKLAASPAADEADAASSVEQTALQAAAIARLGFGELLESLARRAARAIVGDEQAPRSDVDQRALAALYYDSYCAAVWTSARITPASTVMA